MKRCGVKKNKKGARCRLQYGSSLRDTFLWARCLATFILHPACTLYLHNIIVFAAELLSSCLPSPRSYSGKQQSLPRSHRQIQGHRDCQSSTRVPRCSSQIILCRTKVRGQRSPQVSPGVLMLCGGMGVNSSILHLQRMRYENLDPPCTVLQK